MRRNVSLEVTGSRSSTCNSGASGRHGVARDHRPAGSRSPEVTSQCRVGRGRRSGDRCRSHAGDGRREHRRRGLPARQPRPERDARRRRGRTGETALGQAYTLEVSSPGLDRPLRHEADYRRFVGRLAKIVTSKPVDGQSAFPAGWAVSRAATWSSRRAGRAHRVPLARSSAGGWKWNSKRKARGGSVKFETTQRRR